MSKEKIPAPEPDHDRVGPPLRSFFVPHKRVQWTGEVIDPHTGIVTIPPSMTKQSFADECDINNILKQFSLTGQIAHINDKAASGVFMDLPDEQDFQTALNTVIAGENAFDALPSKLRSRFGNDAANFLEFMADPANQDEAIKLGLAVDTRPAPGPLPPPETSRSSQDVAKDAKTGVQGNPPAPSS